METERGNTASGLTTSGQPGGANLSVEVSEGNDYRLRPASIDVALGRDHGFGDSGGDVCRLGMALGQFRSHFGDDVIQ